MNINVDNCRESLENSMNVVKDVLEPLQKENYQVRVALTNVRLMYVTANNILDSYKELKEG